MSRKRAVFTIITCSIAVVLLSGVLLVGLRNNGFGFVGSLGQERGKPAGNEYTIDLDPAVDPVEDLEINWEAGPVRIEVTDGDKVRITETCSQQLSDEEHMAVSVAQKKLEIDWDGNRFRFLSLPFFTSWEKGLVVELPRHIAQAMAEVECSNISGEIEAGWLACQEAEFSSVSGDISLTGIECAEECRLSTTSGGAVIAGLTAHRLSASTTSGRLHFENAALAEADLDTVSGELHFRGSVEEVFGHSTISGAAFAALDACPKELDMNSVSGGLTVVLPENASFRAEHSSVSGDFGCDFAGKDGSYGSGQPQGELSFSTTSGNIRITTE